jgi:hypothetical protein
MCKLLSRFLFVRTTLWWCPQFFFLKAFCTDSILCPLKGACSCILWVFFYTQIICYLSVYHAILSAFNCTAKNGRPGGKPATENVRKERYWMHMSLISSLCLKLKFMSADKWHSWLLHPGTIIDVFMVLASSEEHKNYLQILPQPNRIFGYNKQCTVLIWKAFWYVLSNSESQRGCGNAT